MSEERYIAQIAQPGFGREGQQRLERSRVAIIGVGGLGCPAALYLAAAGVGHLTLVDPDTVDVSNLHRQILFDDRDLGQGKAAAAAATLMHRYSVCTVASVSEMLTTETVAQIIGGHDVVLDATDDMHATLALDDCCRRLNIPLVYAAVYRGSAQVAVFTRDTGMYRDVFPGLTAASPTACSADGVIGPVTGVLGTLMALECVKLIVRIGQPRTGVLTYLDLYQNTTFDVEIGERHVEVGEHLAHAQRISVSDTVAALRSGTAVLVDVREQHESPRCTWPGVISMPGGRCATDELPPGCDVIFACARGQRSAAAAAMPRKLRHGQRVFSMIGGVDDLNTALQNGITEHLHG